MKIDLLIDKVDGYDYLTQKEKVKTISYFYCISNQVDLFTASSIKECFEKNSLEVPANINRELSSLVSSKPPILIKKSNGYSFQRNSKKHLDEIFLAEKHSKEISLTLRDIVPKVNVIEQRNFLDEAISCYEIKSFRAAIILTWLLVMDVLLEYTLRNKLTAFNDELRKRNKKKIIQFKPDFEEYKESEIIEVFKAVGIISKEQKKLLDEKLNIRNSAAHPNVTQFREPKVVTFIQELAEEILFKF